VTVIREKKKKNKKVLKMEIEKGGGKMISSLEILKGQAHLFCRASEKKRKKGF